MVFVGWRNKSLAGNSLVVNLFAYDLLASISLGGNSLALMTGKSLSAHSLVVNLLAGNLLTDNLLAVYLFAFNMLAGKIVC